MLDFFRSAVHLFFPRVCPVCDRVLADGEYLFCTRCRWEMPLTRFWENPANPVHEKLSALVPLRSASSFLFYRKHSGVAGMVHRFKYKGDSRLAYTLGRWYGLEINEAGGVDADAIAPVPLHPFRRMGRGYNQAEMIARGLSESLGIPVHTGNLVRKSYTASQTRQSRKDRWENVEGIFRLRRPREWNGRHILLVDDVLTTGATLVGCAETLLREAPDCAVSVATLATTAVDPLGQ